MRRRRMTRGVRRRIKRARNRRRGRRLSKVVRVSRGGIRL